MKTVLIIGSGGREHALAWALAHSPQVSQIYVVQGNGGTAWEQAEGLAACQSIALPLYDFPALVEFAQTQAVDLTVVGPEEPLAKGIVDAFQAAHLNIFGPSAAAAQLEASKAFAKEFMVAHHIPTAAYGIFTDYDSAWNFAQSFGRQMVVKASGLAAGKGVLVCDNLQEVQAALQQIFIDHAFGDAGQQVVIEERLSGREASVLAFCDGKTTALMPVARDHKRALDGDQGLNTGGMGAFAPAQDLTPDQLSYIQAQILQPVLDGMQERGTPYVGILYAGVMLTEYGVQVLEFNCRFGDPETQVILPLLETDLYEVFQACLEGRLAELDLQWKNEFCAAVVLASEGYPQAYPTGLPIQINPWSEGVIFHAGTLYHQQQLVTSGGRVLAVTAWGGTLDEALRRAYRGVEQVQFEGKHYRRDIGGSAYQLAGVNIDAGAAVVKGIKAAVQATYTPAVLSDLGHFGGLYDISALKTMIRPILVASTDGVGTKTKVAAKLGKWDTLGQDLVNHCINDILVQGAKPLFFLDYVASSRLDPQQMIHLVQGMAQACQLAGCALLGGETAEMPQVYLDGEVDLVGTVVGVVDHADLIDGSQIQAGDVILGLPSTGLHTNGYSLARRVLADLDWTSPHPELGSSIGEALLAVHRSYLPAIQALEGLPIHGLAHITGGGIVDNLPRILPDGLGAEIDTQAWVVPPLFKLIQQVGQISTAEMLRVFNMGLGMLIVTTTEALPDMQARLGEPSYLVGKIVAGKTGVSF